MNHTLSSVTTTLCVSLLYTNRMTIDDSTLIAQAISSSTKRIRRFIYDNVTRDRLQGVYLLGNSALLLRAVSTVFYWVLMISCPIQTESASC